MKYGIIQLIYIGPTVEFTVEVCNSKQVVVARTADLVAYIINQIYSSSSNIYIGFTNHGVWWLAQDLNRSHLDPVKC